MEATRPADGTARPDLYDPANPQVTLTLDADTAFKLRRFLRDKDIGKHTEEDPALYHKVYRPLLQVEDSIRQAIERHADAIRARADIDRAEANRLEALSAGLYRGPS